MTPMLTLYNYWRSGPSYRVRIALALKGVAYRYVPVDLRTGVQGEAANRARNPQAFVPTLELKDGTLLTQSPAILEWLEETHPTPALLPTEPLARARVRAMAALIACDIHPLHNLRILLHLRDALGQDQEGINSWSRRWIEEGFTALETMLAQGPAGRFCWGDAPTLADVTLIPQIASGARFDVDMGRFPRLAAINAAAQAHPAFQAAHPMQQPDAEG